MIEEETVEGMKDCLIRILGKTRIELHEKGAKAKEFVLSNKGEKKQADKLIKMFELL